MSGFVKRSAKNVNPAGGINPAQQPNVGQFGWTTFDAHNVNQIIEYVNICKELMEQTKGYADYVESRFSELTDFMDFIETVYGELKPIIDQIQPIYQDIIFRHEDVITRHIDVIKLHNAVTADKIEINAIKEDAVNETNAIKDATIAESNAIKDATIAETTAIKVLATGEADRAKREADRAATEAVKSENSATDSAASAIVSGTEAGKAAASAKDAADIAEELRKGQVYRGTWNIQANAKYPPAPETNSVWDITLNEGQTEYRFDNTTWYWGDRLLYLKDSNKFSQIESGSTVISVNGKGGAVTLNAADVGALPITGGTVTGELKIGDTIVIDNKFVKGTNNAIIMRDHGNGNVTLSAGLNASGVAGDLYLGYNGTASGTAGYNTRVIQVRSPMQWEAKHTLVNNAGQVNSESMYGPIRTEKDSGNVWHTIVGGTDTVNRGRTIIAGGECGKAIYDNTTSGGEQVHIGGDDTNGVNFYTGLQNGWGGSTHHRYWFNQGNLHTQPMSGGPSQKYYHTGNKPTPTELGVVNKAGDTSIGDLTAANGKTFDATLTHRSGYMSIYPYNSNYGSSGNRLRMYYKEHNNGNPSDLSRGLVINSNDVDGTSHPMDIWLGGHKVYHAGNKPTTADIGAVPLDGSVPMTHNLYTKGLIFTQDDGAILDKDQEVVVQTTKHFGANLFGSDKKQTYLVFKDNLIARKGVTDYKVYHEGFKPELADLLGQGSSTFKTVTLTAPPGVVSGKYYPILFNGTTGFPDVQISTATSAASSSMNNCSFKGQVLSGGWSDRGRYATGNFRIYDDKERSIHSIVGASEADNHYVIYVEARAFPVEVTTNSKVTVTSTGKDTNFGTSVYKAGISGMTASGDYGTKTSLLLDFVRGEGFYGGTVRSNYVDATGVNSSGRINILDYNDNGAFITRRPGKPSYSMMGQDSNGNTMLGLGVDSSGYSAYLKVSGSTLGYSANGSTENRVYHEGFKPSLGELGGIASTGGTMTGELILNVNTPAPLTVKGGTKVGVKFTASGRDRYVGIDSGGYLTFSGGPDYDTGNKVYHAGFKPSAADVGAIATTGGRMTGKLQIYGASSQLELIENDQTTDKTWRFEAQNNNLDFTESGVATRLRLHAGGGSTFSGNMAVGGHITLNPGNILKFPTTNYAAGAQMYTRDGGQYGSDFVLNTGGNMILGAGESGTALAGLMTSGSEHAYVAADGDVYVMPKCNNIAERITHKFGADGNVTFNAATTAARTYYGATDSYIARSGANMYVAANAANGKVYIEGKTNPVARVNGADYTIYHSGNLPTFGDLSAGKAIGSSTALGVVDLNDYKTSGVYHQGSNAQAISGMNYPELLAGSLTIYQSAGVTQEYRIYNTSRMWRRSFYNDAGGWSAWTKDYNSVTKPTAAELGVLPTSGGTLSGNLVVNGDITTSKGMTITGTGNIQAMAGGTLRCNTSNVMSMDGKNYAFVTGTLDAHLCSNAYWDGATWRKYDSSKESMYAVVNPNGQFKLLASSATSTNPNELTPVLIDKVGNASFGGIVAPAQLISPGQVEGSYMQVRNSGNPAFEMHDPGKAAAMMYKPHQTANVRFCQSNGAGGEAVGYGEIGAGGFSTVNGSYRARYGNGNRAWTGVGQNAFWMETHVVDHAGSLLGIVGTQMQRPGVWALEANYGMFNNNDNADDAAHVLCMSDGGNYNRRWEFRNGGYIMSPRGGGNGEFEISGSQLSMRRGSNWGNFIGDGNLTGNIFGGYANMVSWCQAAFAPASDARLKIILGESTKSALDVVDQFQFKKFAWNEASGEVYTSRSKKVTDIGLIAQEVEAIDPNFVKDIKTEGEGATDIKALDTASLLAVALKAIQELKAEVEDLKEKLNDLV